MYRWLGQARRVSGGGGGGGAWAFDSKIAVRDDGVDLAYWDSGFRAWGFGLIRLRVYMS